MMTSLYSPIKDKTLWSGRADALPHDYVFQIIQPLNLNERNKPLNGYALLGFECDTGVSRNGGRRGAKEGPASFRQALAKLPVHQPLTLYDAGNVRCDENDLEAAQQELGTRVAQLLSLNLMPLVIGGGHETAWGHYQGLAQHVKMSNVAILNFDAHFDLRPLMDGSLGHSGTPFRQIHTSTALNRQPFNYYCAGLQPLSNTKRLFDYAHEHHVQYVLAETIQKNPYDLQFIEHIIEAHETIYVSLCLDVFHASIAPGVSAPQALGIGFEYVMNALRLLKACGKVISLDLVELAPSLDLNQQTAKLAAALLMTYLS